MDKKHECDRQGQINDENGYMLSNAIWFTITASLVYD